MTVATPNLGLVKPEGTDNARDFLKGAIAGGGLWHSMEVLDDAALLTATQTLTNKTLITPTIASFINAQHGHTNAASGGAIGSGATLTNPILSGSVTGSPFTFENTGGQAALNINGSAAVALRLRDTAAAADNEIWELGSTNGVFQIGAVNDAISQNFSALQAARSGTTVTGMGYGNNRAPVARVTHQFGGHTQQAGASQDAAVVSITAVVQKTASTGNLFGTQATVTANVDAAVTATAAVGLYSVINGTNNGTITSVETVRVDSPGITGGTITSQYVIKHGNTAANLDTAGTWNNASAEFNEDGSRRKWPRALLSERIDPLEALDHLPVHVYAFDENAAEEHAGVFAEELHAIDPSLSNGKTVAHGPWALALAAVQQLKARVAVLEAR